MAVELGHLEHGGVVLVAETLDIGRCPWRTRNIVAGVDHRLGREILIEALGGSGRGRTQVHAPAERLHGTERAPGPAERRTPPRPDMPAPQTGNAAGGER